MGQYKLVALDMDGTLLNEQKEISLENEKCIRTALNRGISVIFSTGRGVQSIGQYIEQLNLKTPIVAVNGSEVWREPGVLLKRHLLEPQLVKRLRELALTYDTWYWAYSVDGPMNKERWTDDMDGTQWLKFGYYTENDDYRSKILHTVQSWDCFEITNSHPCNLELNPKGINKAAGIQEVCSLLGIGMSQVVAIGDSLNDISMIQAAGLGVAMGNAQEQVKQAADLVTSTNDEDGVAQIIKEYVLA